MRKVIISRYDCESIRAPRFIAVLLSLADRCHFDDPRASRGSLNVSAEHSLLNEKATHQIGMGNTMVEMTAPAYRDEKGNRAPRREPNFLPVTPSNGTSTPDHAVALPPTVSADFREVGRSFCSPSQMLDNHTLDSVISLSFTVLLSYDLRWVDPLCFLTAPQIRKKEIRRKPLPLSIDPCTRAM